MNEEIFKSAVNQIENLKSALDKAKNQIIKTLPELPEKERAVVNNGLGKVEKLMKEVKFPSFDTIGNDSDFINVNNKIINKLGEVSKEFEKLRETCLL